MENNDNNDNNENTEKTELPHRFKKYNKGGPGRPRKEECYNDIVREMLESKHIDLYITNDQGQLKRICMTASATFLHAIVAGQMLKAISGDTQSANHLVERGYGKVSDKLELSGMVDNKIEIEVIDKRGEQVKRLEEPAIITLQSENYTVTENDNKQSVCNSESENKG